MQNEQIAGLFYSLSAEWEKGSLSKISSGFKNVSALFVSTVATASASMAGLFETTKHYANAQKELGNLAKNNSITLSSLQELQHSYKSVGLEVDDLTSTLEKLKNTDSIKELGIKKSDFKTNKDFFYSIIDNLKKIEDKSKRVELAKKILGDYDVEKILKGGSKAIKQQAKELEDLGITLNSLDQGKANNFNKQLQATTNTFTELSSIMSMVFKKLMADVMPIFSALMKRFNDFIRANKELIFNDLKKWITGIVKGFRFVIDLIVRAIEHVGGLKNVFIALAGILALWNAPLLLTVGAVFLVLLAFDDLMSFIEGKDSIIGDFVESAKTSLADFKAEFPTLTAVATTVVDVIVATFTYLNSALWNIWDLIAGNTTFSEYLDSNIAITKTFFNSISQTFSGLYESIKNTFLSISTYITETINYIIETIKNFISSVMNMFSNLDLVGAVTKQIAKVKKTISDFTPNFDFSMPDISINSALNSLGFGDKKEAKVKAPAVAKNSTTTNTYNINANVNATNKSISQVMAELAVQKGF